MSRPDLEVGDEIITTGKNGSGIAFAPGIRGLVERVDASAKNWEHWRYTIQFLDLSEGQWREYCLKDGGTGIFNSSYASIAERFKKTVPVNEWEGELELL